MKLTMQCCTDRKAIKTYTAKHDKTCRRPAIDSYFVSAATFTMEVETQNKSFHAGNTESFKG